MRVGVALSIGSLRILAVGVSIKGSCWLHLGVATSASSFDLFDKGPMRVGVAISIGSLRILAVGLSIKRSSWLDLPVATSASSFDLSSGFSNPMDSW